MLRALLATTLLALAPPAGAGAAAPPPRSPAEASSGPAHDLHVSYGSSVVEENVVVVRIRFFADDLAAALGAFGGVPELVLTDDAAVHALFLRYFRARFSVEIGGRPLDAQIVGSGSDMLDREPVWWYAVQFVADTPVTAFRVRNALLLELFDDQTNIVKFVRFPDQTQRTYSFGAGEEAFEIRF